MEKGGSLVWARNAFRRDQLWPGVVLPEGSVPDFIQRLQTPGRVCVCFYGPSIAQSRVRDYFWLLAEELTAWTDYSISEQPAPNAVYGDHYEAFKVAHEEALSVDAGYLDPIQGMLPKVDPSAACCLCCGRTLKFKDAAVAKEHEGRCDDCQQLFLAGQRCTVCNRVWFDYEADSMATCKRCGARIHPACDPRAEKTVKAAAAERAAASIKPEQQDEPMDIDQQQQLVPADASQQQAQKQSAHYNCPACCQKEADESRMDLLHLHAVVLADIKPSKPRPAAEIFAAEVTRKHLEAGGQMDLQLLQRLISTAWVEEEDKGKYERQAQQEQEAFMAAVPQYEALFRQYINLAASLRREVDLSLALEPQRVLGSGSVVLARGAAAPQSHAIAAAGTSSQLLLGGVSNTRSQQQQQPAQLAAPSRGSAAAAAAAGSVQAPAAAAAGTSGPPSKGRPAHVSVLGSGTVIKAEDGSDVPQQIPILCNTTKGTFLLAEMKVVCSCATCAELSLERRTFSPTQFEQHAGAGSAKKWKASLRIEPGAVKECPAGANPMAFGKWMDIKGIEAKGSKVSGANPAQPAAEVAQLLLDGPAASVKREPRAVVEQQQQQQQQQRQVSLIPSGPAYSGDGFAVTVSGAGGPSPASSSRGPVEGAAAAGGAGGAAATSSADQKPASTGIPKNRRPDSWAPWEDINLGQYKPIQVKFAGDRCCVCDNDVDFDIDRLVSCDGCGITVHQSCYGVPELPDEDDMWLCRSCELKEPGAPEPQCCLCPVTGGGLKPTTIPGLWAHAACMQWIPEVTCIEPNRMEPIDRIQHIQKERWELLCCICRQRMGAKIQCNDCYQAYHPLCARRVGLHMEMVEPAVPDGPLQLLTFCPRHCKPRPEKSGITLLNPEDSFRTGRPRKRLNDAAGGTSSTAVADPGSNNPADPNNNNGLWNAQPFQCIKPPAAIPPAPGGCARASAFNAKQISHGTGTGRTSIAGFWIPGAEAAAAAAAASEGGRQCSSSNVAFEHQGSITSGAAAAGKPGRKRRRWGKSSSSKVHSLKTAARPKSAKLLASGEPPPVVELLPLPDDVPDRVPVVCNARSAIFLLRAQRVLMGDQEMTASRFEALCGKGDAKKWKSSLWAANADGQPDVCMGDWLSTRGLDKAALAKLISNWNAYELRKTWEEQQQQQQDGAAAATDDEDPQEEEAAGSPGIAAADTDAEPWCPADSSVGDGATTDGDDAATTDADGATTDGDGGVDSDLEDQQQQNGTAASAAAAEDQLDQQGARSKVSRQQEIVASAAAEGAAAALEAAEPAAKRLKLQNGSAAAALASTAAANGVDAASSPLASPNPAADEDQAAAAAADLQQQQQADGGSSGNGELLGSEQQVIPEPQEPQQVQQLQDNAATADAIATGVAAAAAAGGDLAGADARPIDTAASAAEIRKQKGLVLLLRMHYKQLPDNYKVHPSSLPQQAQLAADAKQQEQQHHPQQQQQLSGLIQPQDGIAAGSSIDQQVSAVTDPWLVVGRCCRMYWTDDEAWYDADVTGYDSSTGQHKLWYHIDEVSESIDLAAEEKEGRVQWLPLADKLRWPKPPDKHQEQGLGGFGSDGMAGLEYLDPAGLQAALWQQDAAGGGMGWIQQDQQQLYMLMQNGGIADQGIMQQQQQQQGVVAAGGATDQTLDSDQGDAAAVQQLAQLPAGFQRLTAMSRDPTDTAAVDLVALASSGLNLQQQMQHMLQQQQEQFQQYNATQPSWEDAPQGTAVVGWRVGIFSLQSAAFYYGVVTQFKPESDSHTVEYDDGLIEDVQLQQSRVDWVTANGYAMSQAGKQAHEAYRQQRLAAAAAEYQQRKQLQQLASSSAGQQQQQQGQIIVQLQLQLQQALGEIQQLGLQPGDPAPPHLQQRVQQIVLLLQHHQQQQQQQWQGNAAAGMAAAAPATAAPASGAAAGSGPKPGPKPGAPTQVEIICGTNTATFDCTRMAVMASSGGYISPTEFERISGKGSSKKWKCTIRVRKANGLPGITMGDWLIQMGYDQPKQPGPAGEAPGRARTSLNDIRRQYASRKAAAPPVRRTSSGTGAAEGGKQSPAAGQSVVTARGVALHRDGCMCVICKQARRKAAQEAGIAPNPEDAYVPRQPGEGKPGPSSRSAGYSGYGKSAPIRGSSLLGKDGVLGPAEEAADQRRKKLNLPTVLVGKRAFVRAVPQLVRGATVHKLWQIPKSKCYTAEQWEALHSAADDLKPSADGAADNAAAAAGSSRAGTPSLPNSRAATPPLPAAAAVAGSTDAAAAVDSITAAAAGADQLQLVPHQQQQQQPEKQEKKGSRTQTWREKLRVCQALEPKRITFGKSGIHGWGIFARDDIPQDTMVTEFRGQLVRCILADVREHQYRKEHRDCYMFHATDETVIDNTRGGNYARFCNHCCYPCLYAKPLELGGELHLCFFARTNVKMGQELTFDYRFKEEDSDDKILCQCGAPNCKGTLN